MREERNIWVIGGDLRQAKLAEVLVEDGHTVHSYGLERVPEASPLLSGDSLEGVHLADCVILPLPVEGETGLVNSPLSTKKIVLAQLFGLLRPHQLVCGGKISPQLALLAEDYQIQLCDYFHREELAVANAVPTVLVV